VDLVEVDVVGPQPPQAGVDGREDVLAREAAGVGRALGSLGAASVKAMSTGKNTLVARTTSSRRANSAGTPVSSSDAPAEQEVGRVEEVDAELDGASHQGRLAASSRIQLRQRGVP
jgi:hypothetical protein